MLWKRNLLTLIVIITITGINLQLASIVSANSSLEDLTPVDRSFSKHMSQTKSISTIEGQLNRRTLYDALIAYDIPPSEIISLSKSFKPIFDFRYSMPDDYYQVYIDERKMIRKFIYKTSPMDEYEAVKDENGKFIINKRKIVLDRQTKAKVFTIESSLFQAVEESTENPEIVYLIADVFAYDIDFYLYPRKGDRIAVVYECYYKDGTFVKFGNILAARYVGRKKTFSAFLFNDGRLTNYYDENGQPLSSAFLRTPLQFGKMRSGYAIRRFHPILKRYRAHTGIDYGAPIGTPILATASGKVRFAGWRNGYGKLIIVHHSNGYETYYGHCSRLLRRSGQTVEQGDIIARVGQTGSATGPHVHYEIRAKGKPINPVNVKKSPGRPLEPEMEAKFRETVSERLSTIESLLSGENSHGLMSRDNQLHE